MKHLHLASIALLLLFAIACGETQSIQIDGPAVNEPVTGTESGVQPSTTDSNWIPGKGDYGTVQQGLTLTEVQDGIEGLFVEGRQMVRMRSTVVRGVNYITIELRGMTLVAQVDKKLGEMHLEGFASSTGKDTRIGAEDQDLLQAAIKVVEAKLAKNRDDVQEMLVRTLNVWQQYPRSHELRKYIRAEKGRDYTSICNLIGTYQEVTHDCNKGERWADNTTYNAWISMTAAGPCSDGTYFWKNGQWVCYEPDHDTTVEYAYGNCFGRCGASCGSGTQFTWDCADHDSCVRFGHTTASLYCDDEVTSTLDDLMFAPNCY